mmetsp:Transcript_14229/g.43052  ORF Transcript_14229/g.43052 Transcript_14229/m.43052 type:complete len:275 (-) Transcript_14229:1188-2012(-)
MRRHPEAARRDLFNRRPAIVEEAHGVLAALARVGAAAERVHRNRERLVGLLRDRAQRHGARHEPLDDLLRGLDVLQLHGLGPFFCQRFGLPPQQPAQRAGGVVVVDDLRVHLEGLARVFARRSLQVHHGLRRIQVGLAAVAEVELARVRQPRHRGLDDDRRRRQRRRPSGHFGGRVEAGPGDGVQKLGVRLQRVEAGAADSRRRAREADVHDRRVQADRFKNLSALVRLERRDAHLRHDLQHALRQGLAVRERQRLVVGHVVGIRQYVAHARAD